MEYVSTNNAPGAIGPYSQAVKANGLLFTSGQIAINPATNTVEAKTIEEKIETTFSDAYHALESANIMMGCDTVTDLAHSAAVEEKVQIGRAHV